MSTQDFRKEAVKKKNTAERHSLTRSVKKWNQSTKERDKKMN